MWRGWLEWQEIIKWIKEANKNKYKSQEQPANQPTKQQRKRWHQKTTIKSQQTNKAPTKRRKYKATNKQTTTTKSRGRYMRYHRAYYKQNPNHWEDTEHRGKYALPKVIYKTWAWRQILNTDGQVTLVMYFKFSTHLIICQCKPLVLQPAIQNKALALHTVAFQLPVPQFTKHTTPSPTGPLFPVPFHSFGCAPIGWLWRTNRCRDQVSLSVSRVLWTLGVFGWSSEVAVFVFPALVQFARHHEDSGCRFRCRCGNRSVL